MNNDRTKTTAGMPGESQPSQGRMVPQKTRLRWLWIALSVMGLGVVLYGLGYLEDTADVTRTETPQPLPLVSAKNIKTTSQQMLIRSVAEVRPRWSAELTASVAGRITRVFESALAGEPVEAGAQLIEIESSQYVAELAAAEQANKEAELALWQARNATLLAREDFERNNRKPPNDLALKLPQLGVAESAIISAKARVDAARRRLEDTIVVAPFAAFVTDRFVSPGQSVSPGDRLVKLVDRSSFELVAEIGRDDWALLRRPLEGQPARLLDQDGKEIAKATVRRGGGFLDDKSRQYRVFLETDKNGANTLLTGDFVNVLLEGISIDRALDVPSSALTQDGFVWTVDDADELQRFEPEVLFRRHDRVIVRAPEGTTNWRVAITPLVSFLPGRKIEPRPTEN